MDEKHAPCMGSPKHAPCFLDQTQWLVSLARPSGREMIWLDRVCGHKLVWFPDSQYSVAEGLGTRLFLWPPFVGGACFVH